MAIDIKQSVSLAPYTWYKIGGPAEFFVSIKSDHEYQEALEFASEKQIQTTILSEGSNVLVSDKGIQGLVINPLNKDISVDSNIISAGSGASLKDVLEASLDHGLTGLEWAGGLPGSFGAAIRGNVGAYGGEIADCVNSVVMYTFEVSEWKRIELTADKMKFSYRSSLAKLNGNIVISATLKLNQPEATDVESARDEMLSHIQSRAERHPLEYPNCGSVFKNIHDPQTVDKILKIVPELKNSVASKWHGKIPAAALIQHAGLQGYKQGGAQISDKHAAFIVNIENSKSSDVKKIIEHVQSELKNKYNIELEPEVQFLGF